MSRLLASSVICYWQINNKDTSLYPVGKVLWKTYASYINNVKLFYIAPLHGYLYHPPHSSEVSFLSNSSCVFIEVF